MLRCAQTVPALRARRGVGRVNASAVALVANAIRVTGTGILAYKVDPGYATGVSHSTAGMIVFGIGLALFLLVDWCLKPDVFEPVGVPDSRRPGAGDQEPAVPDAATRDDVDRS